MSKYRKGKHTVYYHRYHIVWITKYRYKVMTRKMKERVRELVSQVAEELRVEIISGVVAGDHVHLLVSIPPHVSESDFVKKAKGRSSRKVQQEYPELKKRFWGRHFWARGFFSATSGNITDEMVEEYINSHGEANDPNTISKIDIE